MAISPLSLLPESWRTGLRAAKNWRRATGHAIPAQGAPLVQKDEPPVHAKRSFFWLAAASLQHKFSGCWLSAATTTHLHDRCIKLYLCHCSHTGEQESDLKGKLSRKEKCLLPEKQVFFLALFSPPSIFLGCWLYFPSPGETIGMQIHRSLQTLCTLAERH